MKYEAAKALFDQRCKTAGEKIYKTVEAVEGVYLDRLREPAEDAWFDRQFSQYDVFASEAGGNGQLGGVLTNLKIGEAPPDSYILSFLKPRIIDPPSSETIPDNAIGRYKYIEATDPTSGRIYRYAAQSIAISRVLPEYAPWVRQTELTRIEIDKRTARYSVTWKDISVPMDREHWITGSEIRIVDLSSNELMGERIGYVMDFAQGSRSGSRSPWLFAKPCANYQPPKRQTRFFVESVLKPLKGE